MTENEEKVAEDQEKEVDTAPEAQQEDSGGTRPGHRRGGLTGEG